MGRRKEGTLLPLEVDILEVGLELRRAGDGEFHGFELAKHIAASGTARKLTAHGTLYKALGRMEDMGLLTSDWEDPELAVAEGRPRRRLYQVSGEGERAYASWRQQHPAGAPRRPSVQGQS